MGDWAKSDIQRNQLQRRGWPRLGGCAVLGCVWWLTVAAPMPAQAELGSYEKAKALKEQLDRDPNRMKYRDRWLKVIAAFEAVPTTDGQWCAARFTIGRLYQGLAAASYAERDAQAAVAAYDQVVERCRHSTLADDAAYHAATIQLEHEQHDDALRRVREALALFPTGDMRGKLRLLLAQFGQDASPEPAAADPPREAELNAAIQRALSARLADEATPTESSEAPPPAALAPDDVVILPDAEERRLTAVGLTADADAVVATLDFTSLPPFTQGELAADAVNPRRAYYDFRDTRRGPEAAEPVVPAGLPLKRIRLGEPRPGTVRVVLDLEDNAPAPEMTTTFKPPRLALRLPLGAPAAAPPGEPPSLARPAAAAETSAFVLRTVVIDPGHGGDDVGAVGRGGLQEKNVALSIAKEVKAVLAKRLPGVRVLLTRESDRRLTLKDRSDFANQAEADLFVSIHANASRSRKSKGVETYYLDNTADRYAVRLAGRENRDLGYNIDDLEFILADMLTSVNVDESILLARYIQRSMVSRLTRHYADVEDRGVRAALFFVLLNVRMPAVLAEVSFISHPLEEKRLRDARYLRHLAEAIADGVAAYRDAMANPSAVSRTP